MLIDLLSQKQFSELSDPKPQITRVLIDTCLSFLVWPNMWTSNANLVVRYIYPLKHHFYFVIKCCNLHLGSVEELHQIFSAFQSKVMEKEQTLREVRFLYFMYFNDRLFSFVKLQIMACRIFKIILNMSVLSLCPKHCLLTCF